MLITGGGCLFAVGVAFVLAHFAEGLVLVCVERLAHAIIFLACLAPPALLHDRHVGGLQGVVIVGVDAAIVVIAVDGLVEVGTGGNGLGKVERRGRGLAQRWGRLALRRIEATAAHNGGCLRQRQLRRLQMGIGSSRRGGRDG